jgi:uncharacterized protein (TIGR02118 family)
VRRYVQGHPLLSGYNRAVLPHFDGIEEICFDSFEEMERLWPTAEGRAILANFANFVDLRRLSRILTREVIIKDGSIQDGMVKSYEFGKGRSDLSPRDFHRYWEEVHGPLAAKIEVIKRYVQAHTLMSEYEKEKLPLYDGIAETWFTDTAAMRRAEVSPELEIVRNDENNFLDGPLSVVLSNEKRII